MFLIILTYTRGLDKIEEHLAAHRIFLDKYYAQNKFICSGPQNPRTGGVIICKAENLQEVERIISEDPFNRNDIASYQIIEFEPMKYADEFKFFVE